MELISEFYSHRDRSWGERRRGAYYTARTRGGAAGRAGGGDVEFSLAGHARLMAKLTSSAQALFEEVLNKLRSSGGEKLAKY